MVVVGVKDTSTDDINDAFKEKDDKYRVWATQETREKKVVMAVMVPPRSPILFISVIFSLPVDCFTFSFIH